MSTYVIRRLVGTVPVLFVATTLAFLVLQLIPGDPVNLMLGGGPTSLELRENLRKKLGVSFRTRQPVVEVIRQQLPATLELAAGGMLIGVTFGMAMGVIAGIRPNSVIDTTTMLIAIIGISIPGYWTAMLLIFIFGLKLGWVPIVGSGLPALIIPSTVFGSFAVGDIARLVRSSIVEVRNEDYIRTARAKGLPERRVILRHALRNAMIPVVTLIGLQLGLFVGGGVITETVFARQGIGKLLVDAILEKDYPIVQAIILMITSAYVFANFAVDILYSILDPRIRY